MNKRIELRDICGYLPHGLKIQNGKEYDDVTGCDMEKVYSVFRGHLYNEYDFEDVIPILYPCDSLYNTITQNGKEIMPILELQKIALPDYIFDLIGNKCYWESIHRRILHFFFEDGMFKLNDLDIGYLTVNQVPLFDFLNELKIDYRGLIDSGLAISVYDLKINPYK